MDVDHRPYAQSILAEPVARTTKTESVDLETSPEWHPSFPGSWRQQHGLQLGSIAIDSRTRFRTQWISDLTQGKSPR